MADSDASPLIAFCALLLSDGEVTEDEAYSLAEWLNEHPAIAGSWPATELIEPLQAIWADGTASTRECHRLARILLSVQREWAKRASRKAPGKRAKALPAVVHRDTTEPRLPSLKFQTKIPSRAEGGVFYQVDLAGPSCSCPDWRGGRSGLPPGHLSRCCKHVFDAYAQLPEGMATADWLEAFIELAWPASPKTEWQLSTINSNLVLYSTASEKGWANCFARGGSTYERFGYNVKEQRWAYGSSPHSAWAISEAIIALAATDSTLTPADQLPGASRRETARQSQGVSIAVIAVTGAMVVLGMVFHLLKLPSENRLRQVQASSSPGPTSSTVATPVQTSARTVSQAAPQPTPSSAAWVTKATRAIRVKAGAREVVIPKGTPLRAVGRSASDVLVSYDGLTVTIPVSATEF